MLSENTLGVSNAFSVPRAAVLGKSRSLQMDDGGEWANEIWAVFRAERNMELQLQEKGR